MKEIGQGIQTYYGYSLYHLTAREYFFHIWLSFPHRFSRDGVDILATPYIQFSFYDLLLLTHVIKFSLRS